ncbi:UPF0488 protein CG14286 [Dendroctonus ponderosae]
MPPPKVKLHKNSGKTRRAPNLPPIQISQNQRVEQPSPSAPDVNPITGLTTEQEQQFQLELYWCIQQFQKALSSGKLAAKQVQEHTKSLNTLMSNTAPIVKKRQVMRMSFGDYRTKMLEDEKRAKKIALKIATGKPSEKSTFYKKANIRDTENDFKFNFPTPDCNGIDEGPPEEKVNGDAPIENNTIFSRSDNSFRFNFSNTSEGNENGTQST